MTIRWPVLLSCLLLLPAAAAAVVHGVSPPFSAMVDAQSAPVGQSGVGDTDEVDPGPPHSVAVVPFSNISRDAGDDWIGDWIAETVTADLESLGNVVVISWDADGSALGEGASASHDLAAAARLGRSVGTRWVVTGGYQRVDRLLRIIVRLVDVQTGLIAETLTTDGTVDEIFVLQDKIVAGLMSGIIGPGMPPSAGTSPRKSAGASWLVRVGVRSAAGSSFPAEMTPAEVQATVSAVAEPGPVEPRQWPRRPCRPASSRVAPV